MRLTRFVLAASLFSALVVPVQAANYAVVESVQSPAWLERDGQRQPLVAGMSLSNRDRIETGRNARAIIQLADGSAVKLGESAMVSLNALGRREGNVFTAAVDVATGAFRLTTDALRKLQGKRAINVRVGTVTAGIRGTDIWGRSDEDSDFVCLLEGRIVVTHASGQSAELTEPLQYYGAERVLNVPAVSSVTQEQADKWVAMTDPQPGFGLVSRGGKWGVLLATAETSEAALELYDRFREAGVHVRVLPQGAGQAVHYDLLAGPVADENQAAYLANRLERQLGLTATPAVRRYAALRGL
mgnify:FL=1